MRMYIRAVGAMCKVEWLRMTLFTTSDKGGGTCFCPCLFVCLSVCMSVTLR